MKYAIISDVHANLLALNIALQDAKKENIDKFIFLGDYVTDGEKSNQVVDIVKKIATYAISGNRENYILNYQPQKKEYNNYKNIADTYNSLSNENLSYIKGLKDSEVVLINGIKILMLHGQQYYSDHYGIDKMFDKIIEKYEFDLCLFGHTHLYLDTVYKNKRFINPGSIGQPTDYPTYKYCIIEITDKIDVKIREFDIKDTYALLKNDYESSEYYNRNMIWINLILLSIKDGKNYCGPFVKMYNDRISSIDNISAKEANIIYDETYQFYRNNILRKNKKP